MILNVSILYPVVTISKMCLIPRHLFMWPPGGVFLI